MDSSLRFILAHFFRYIWACSSFPLVMSHLADSGIHLVFTNGDDIQVCLKNIWCMFFFLVTFHYEARIWWFSALNSGRITCDTIFYINPYESDWSNVSNLFKVFMNWSNKTTVELFKNTNSWEFFMLPPVPVSCRFYQNSQLQKTWSNDWITSSFPAAACWSLIDPNQMCWSRWTPKTFRMIVLQDQHLTPLP